MGFEEMMASAEEVVPMDAVESELANLVCDLRGYGSATAPQGRLARRVQELEEKLAAAVRENRQLREMALQDPLTGLGNRRIFRTQLESAMVFGLRYKSPVTVLLIDLDGMKRLNDTCGHPEGDVQLQRVADVLRASTRGSDLAARLGGDEFAVVMPATDALQATIVAERIRTRVKAMCVPMNCSLTASIGVATLDPQSVDAPTCDELLEYADEALYAAKRGGRNRVEICEPKRKAA